MARSVKVEQFEIHLPVSIVVDFEHLLLIGRGDGGKGAVKNALLDALAGQRSICVLLVEGRAGRFRVEQMACVFAEELLDH